MEGSSPQTSNGESHRKRRRRSSLPGESPRELGQMRTRRDTGSTTFVGSGSGIHFVRTVRRAFAGKNLKHNSDDSAVDESLVPGEDDRIHSRSSSSLLWRGDEVSVTSSVTLSPFDDLVRWTRSYFDSWHPPFPFLHAPTILGILERLSTTGFEGLDHNEGVIVRSIMSISLADRRQLMKEEVDLVPTHLVFHTINDAISALQPILICPSSLPSLQAIVSIQLFLISMLRLNAASRLGGLTVRMACQLGLHRCPARFKQFSNAEAEIRRRLFWTIYTLERYLSQALGLPLDLKDDDLDVCYPDREFHRSSSSGNKDSQYCYSLNLFLLPTLLARHGKIKGMILELRNKSVLHSRTDPDDVARIDAQISRWWNEAQDLVNPDFLDDDTSLSGQFQTHTYGSTPQENDRQSILKPSHRLLLIVQKHESVILLNRPVITSGFNTPAYAGAMQKCIGASKQIISHVYRHLRDSIKMDSTQDGRSHNPLFWPGFVWMVWQSGLILLYAAFEGYYPVNIAQREANRCSSILIHLSRRGNFWPSACATAIADLQATLTRNVTRDSNAAAGESDLSTRVRSPQIVLPHSLDNYSAREFERYGVPDASNGVVRSESNHEELLTQPVNLRQQFNRSPIPSRIDNHRSNGPPNNVLYSPLLGYHTDQATDVPQVSAGSMPQTMFSAPSITDRDRLPEYVDVNASDMWPNINGTEFENIFQLMDMSYLLSE